MASLLVSFSRLTTPRTTTLRGRALRMASAFPVTRAVLASSALVPISTEARVGMETSHDEGRSCWMDRATNDPAAAKEFYGESSGRDYEEMTAPDD